MKKNSIIFGGGGFIGSHLCEELLKLGHNVTIFDKLNFSKINVIHLKKMVKIIEGDFNNKSDLKSSLKNIDYVFHLVSSTIPAMSNLNPVYDVESNLVSSLNLLNLCVRMKIKKVIFISSGGTVYGKPITKLIGENHPSRPICSYGIIKKTIEDYLYLFKNNYGLDYCVFRLSNPYGERQNPFLAQGAVTVFLYKAFKGQIIEIWGDGNVIRDYIYIKDIISVIASFPDRILKTNIFNLSSGKGVSLNHLLNLTREISGKKIKVKYEESRKTDLPRNILDNSLAKKEFHWKPEIGLRKGMEITYNYIKKTYG